MPQATVKQPLLLYALVFSVGLAFSIATLASFSLLEVARARSFDDAERAVRRVASAGSLDHVYAAAREERRQGSSGLFVVTATSAARRGFAIEDVRLAVIDPPAGRNAGIVASAVRAAGPEAYVLQRVDPQPALALAHVEIRRLVVASMIAAVVFGVLTSLMIARLVLPPLSALRKLAGGAQGTEQIAGDNDTPNEIAEVAHAFRRTVRRLEQERRQIEEQHRALERMQAGLIRASKLASVGRLAAGIAHEIGNPLAAVRGYLSLMQRGLEEAEQREVLARSITELNRIHDTIKKLLTYARKDEPDEPLAPISTRAVLDDALALVRGHPALRGVEIDDRVEGSSAPDAIGRAAPLGQVLVNLFLNAAHAMSGTASPRITITKHGEDGAIVLAIEDAGPGIPGDKLEQIFDPFFTTKPPGEGTGLGLAVSRAIVEGMNGELGAASGPGRGARFELRLPAPPA